MGNFTTKPKIILDPTKSLTSPLTASQLVTGLIAVAQFPAGKSFSPLHDI
jgi:hypothetical protein